MSEVKTIDEVIEGLKRASDWEYQGTSDVMPQSAMTNPQAKLVLRQKFEEIGLAVIGEDEEGERRGMRYVANSNTARRNTLRRQQRARLQELLDENFGEMK